ncbi:lysine transporter [Coccidioides immitis H538.4]|uniref:Lysine transporter n=1 Tax=Coccidioides immitis H538.4 TaxID=396776 RepID=A0A0J8RUK1_COCIT|nr:lysine transporter [Coccidioides immitis H538.4]
MAQDKPRGLGPQYQKFSPDDFPEEPSPGSNEMSLEEPVYSEPGRERVGENVWRVLGERQINMITFSGTIGNGEMTALMPVNAPVMEFPRRFVDRGVGFAVGWMYWFAYAVLAADQLVAATNSIKFHYEDKRTYISWVVGENVHSAVWITLVLVIVTMVNMFPVKVFGQLEYIFGSIKLTFITFLILMSVVIDTMQPRSNAYYDKPLGTKYWDEPYGFFNRKFPIKNEDGSVHMMTGSMGSLLGMW